MLNADDFPQQLAEMLAFSREGEEFPVGHPFRTVQAIPTDVHLPPIWLLGSSDFSAQAAAILGLGFAFAHHISPDFAVPAINLYREQFTPSQHLAAPKVIVATTVICAETDEQADDLAVSMGLAWLRLRTGHAGPIPSPEEARAYHYSGTDQVIVRDVRSRQMVGRPEVVRENLLALVGETGADELMVSPMVYGYENRARIYELLAEAFELLAP
jgi:luciferase family oxidoreductase group 1